MKTATLILTLVIVATLWGCSGSEEKTDRSSLFARLKDAQTSEVVATSNYALLAMTELITDSSIEVWTPTDALAVPTSQEMRTLQTSDVLLTNGRGAPFATWLPKVTLDKEKVFETTTHGFELADFIQVNEHQIVHSHGNEAEHTHPWMVPHCWLNPRLALVQAQKICEKLSQIYPDQANTFRENLNKHVEPPLSDLVAQTEHLRIALAQRKTKIVLSDPRVKHLINALDADARYLLWFDPAPNLQAQRTDQFNDLVEVIAKAPAAERVVLVWSRYANSAENQLTNRWPQVELDLIDSPVTGKSFMQRMAENIQKLKEVIEN